MTASNGPSRDINLRASHLRAYAGDDPLAEGALDWPHLPDRRKLDNAIPAWRVWRVDAAGQLLSPFTRTAWIDGENVASDEDCDFSKHYSHPSADPSCTCGLRAVQSLSVAKAVASMIRSTRVDPRSGYFIPCPPHSGITVAIGQVSCYGRVALGTIEADDLPYTLRAQRMVLTSPLTYAPPRAS